LTNKCGNKLKHENEAKGPGPIPFKAVLSWKQCSCDVITY
jgi:hypothetical protein